MKKVYIFLLIIIPSLTYNSCKKTIEKVVPLACFTISPVEIHAGDTVSFNSSCSENAVSLSWEFGDSNTSTDVNPTHKYLVSGDVSVKLTVTNAGGLSDVKTIPITVLAASIPQENIHSGNITTNSVWAAGFHEVTGNVYVDGATLTIAPGSVIKFDQGTGLFIGSKGVITSATLMANGTADNPILFTSAADNKAPGDWTYIGFFNGSSALCSMQYCTVEYGGGNKFGDIYVGDASVTIENCHLQYSATSGINLNENGKFKSFASNDLSNNNGYTLEIYANNAHTIGSGNHFTTNTGIRVLGDSYDQTDKTWNKQNCPYIVDGYIYLGSVSGAKLTIAPGTTIAFAHKSGIFVGYNTNTFGTLDAEGTASDSIHFTSAAIAGSKTGGDWDYLGFYKGAGNSSVLKYCVVEYGGGYSVSYGNVYIEGSSVSIEHSALTNSKTYGVNCSNTGRFASFTNNAITGNTLYPVRIFANNVNTMGDGNTFSGAGILVSGETVGSTVTWHKQPSPYIIDGGVYVQSTGGNTLTIEAGTVLKFTKQSAMYIGYNGPGTLIAKGTASDNIKFTTVAPSGSENPGDWAGIWFYGGTGNGAIIDQCTISYGGGYSANSGNVSIISVVAGSPTISNSIITDSGAYGIYMHSATPVLTGNTFTNNTLGETN